MLRLTRLRRGRCSDTPATPSPDLLTCGLLGVDLVLRLLQIVRIVRVAPRRVVAGILQRLQLRVLVRARLLLRSLLFRLRLRGGRSSHRCGRIARALGHRRSSESGTQCCQYKEERHAFRAGHRHVGLRARNNRSIKMTPGNPAAGTSRLVPSPAFLLALRKAIAMYTCSRKCAHKVQRGVSPFRPPQPGSRHAISTTILPRAVPPVMAS
ncbi:[protein-PII] uridylyltransferase family protein [Paraburkholderia saeva]|uniref:[protein-PII] uridylyltransferase family protein n=1 Tax=Paraburkholderia saeva TaxID=2777537 RepID=UPI003982C89B